MEETRNQLSRRQFLVTAGSFAAGAVLASTGLGFLNPKAQAEGKSLPEYPWTQYFDKELDPEVVREKAVRYYHEGNHCSEAAFRALIEELGSPFSDIPSEVMWFGAGGGASWATLCGALNGAAAAISLIYGRSKTTMALVSELFGWYSETPLPVNESVQSVSGSPLCHSSVTNWCKAAGKKAFSKERAERCGLIAGDTAARAAQLLNDQLTGKFVPAYTIPQEAQECMNCHVEGGMVENTRGKMDCVQCHGNPH